MRSVHRSRCRASASERSRAHPGTAHLPWYLRPLFWLQKRRWGQLLVPALTWARVPPLYLALTGFYAALERKSSPLDPALRALVQARISQVNHCAFCVDINSATLLARGVWAGFADPIAYHAEALITGRIICADCALMQKTGTPAPHAASHHLVIQAQDGKIWTIVLSPMGEELLQRTDIVSHAVRARGYAFPRAGYIQVTDFQFPQN